MLHHFTIRELAQRIDVGNRDILDACIVAGVRLYHLNGQRFHDPAYLKTYLALEWAVDLMGDVEVTLSDEQIEGVARELGVEAADLMFDEVRS